MQCNEFEMRMQMLLDQRRQPERDRQLQSHGQVCPSCSEMLVLQRELFDTLELSEIPALPDDFAERVVSTTEPKKRTLRPAQPTRRTVPMGLLGLAVAATLLIAALPTLWMNHSLNSGSTSTETASARHLGIVAGAPASGQLQQAPKGSEWWVAQTQSILDLYPPQARQRHRQQVDRFADDLRPITTSFTAAVTALRRSIPMGKSREKERPQAASGIRSWFRGLS